MGRLKLGMTKKKVHESIFYPLDPKLDLLGPSELKVWVFL